MNFLRILGIFAALLLMAGFGMCSLFGLAMGFGSHTSDRSQVNFLLLAVAGLAICALLGWGVLVLRRQLLKRNPPP